VKAPTSDERTQMAQTIARRTGRYLEHQGLLEWDVENSYLATDAVNEDPMNLLLGHSITYRIAVWAQAGRPTGHPKASPIPRILWPGGEGDRSA